MQIILAGWSGMQIQGDPKRSNASASYPSPWREAVDLLRFSLEAAAVSGTIVMLAWIFSGHG
jgi:hypothetical protein